MADPGQKYSWSQGGKEAVSTQNPDSVCLTDASTCGCCLMQQTMFRMEEFFNMSLNALRNSLQETRNALTKIRSSRSAFSVALTDKRWCLGPHHDNTTIVYKHIFLNMGGNYNPNNGIFTAPLSGVYSLSLTVYSDSGSEGTELAACATLKVNGVAVSVLKDMNAQDQEDSTTSVVALHLTAGDKVYVTLPKNCYLCDDNSHYNTFTGFLLYTSE
ncbi:Complement C1q-like protein 2 [Merluccius polli]|uniref:Complement C1q-like protein 2 n=1 Tax=Merluccius polli TaxID=89951 RepID=A0AA47M847_MERPO|nr:Complement C1q-like protein 2 [Merluccius polli]